MNEWVWSSGGMILTGENWSTERKTLYSVGGRWMIGYGAMVEWYWQGKTQVLGEKHYTAWVVDEWIWRNGGMILTGENWSTKMSTCRCATVTTINPAMNRVKPRPARLTDWSINQATVFIPKDGGTRILRNAENYLQNNTMSHPWRR